MKHKGFEMSRYATEEAKEKHRQEQRRYMENNPGRALQSLREWNKRNPLKRAEISRNANKKYRAKFPEKYKARMILNGAVRDGKLTKPDVCTKCHRKNRLHGHHT